MSSKENTFLKALLKGYLLEISNCSIHTDYFHTCLYFDGWKLLVAWTFNWGTERANLQKCLHLSSKYEETSSGFGLTWGWENDNLLLWGTVLLNRSMIVICWFFNKQCVIFYSSVQFWVQNKNEMKTKITCSPYIVYWHAEQSCHF